MPSSTRLELENWLSGLKVKADTVIDIGGAQKPVKGRTKTWEVENYLIADLDDPHEGDAPDILLDLNQKDFATYTLENQADIIFCLEVFDYVWNPATAFENIAWMLKPKGRVYMSFLSVYPLHNPVADDALRLMPAGIEKLAKYAGLKVWNMIPRRPRTTALEAAYAAEGMRAAKHEDHAFTGWIVELR